MNEDLNIIEKNELRQMVMSFVKDQQGYSAGHKIEYHVDWVDEWLIACRFELQFTVFSDGKSVNDAYQNFVGNWNVVAGFEPIYHDRLGCLLILEWPYSLGHCFTISLREDRCMPLDSLALFSVFTECGVR